MADFSGLCGGVEDFRLFMHRVEFKEPSKVSFYRANLKGVSFLYTDVSKLSFLGEDWSQKGGH